MSRRLVWNTLQPDATSVLLDYPIRDIELYAETGAQAGLRSPGPIESMEDARGLLGGQALASIRHRHLDLAARPLDAHQDLARRIRVLGGVRQEVHEDLSQAVGVDPEGRGLT